MKLIICLAIFFLTAYADELTTEKIKKAFMRTYGREVLGQANRTRDEKEVWTIRIKKENVDLNFEVKDRKVFSREVLVDSAAKLDGNTFSVNMTAIYFDSKDEGDVIVTGNVGEKNVNETGRMSISFPRMRKSMVVEKAEFNETHVMVLGMIPDVDYGVVDSIEMTGVDLNVTNDELKSAFGESIKIAQTKLLSTLAAIKKDAFERHLINL